MYGFVESRAHYKTIVQVVTDLNTCRTRRPEPGHGSDGFVTTAVTGL